MGKTPNHKLSMSFTAAGGVPVLGNASLTEKNFHEAIVFSVFAHTKYMYVG